MYVCANIIPLSYLQKCTLDQMDLVHNVVVSIYRMTFLDTFYATLVTRENSTELRKKRVHL